MSGDPPVSRILSYGATTLANADEVAMNTACFRPCRVVQRHHGIRPVGLGTHTPDDHFFWRRTSENAEKKLYEKSGRGVRRGLSGHRSGAIRPVLARYT